MCFSILFHYKRRFHILRLVWDIEWLFAVLGQNFRTEAKYSCPVEDSSDSML